MRRFFAEGDQISGGRVALCERESQHAARVLRLEPGDDAVVLDGRGGRLECVVSAVRRHQVTLEIRSRSTTPRPLGCPTLFQALPKPKAFEAILQKAVELGAARIVPVVCERCVAQVDGEAAAAKTAKWRWILIEAMKQSGCLWLPEIDPPAEIKSGVRGQPGLDLEVIGAIRPGALHIRSIFKERELQAAGAFKSLGVWIGPEGDFTDSEIEMVVRTRNARPVTFGDLVLRCETAAICALSILSHENRWLPGA